MKNHIFALLLMGTSLACSNKKIKTEEVTQQDPTPEIFEENKNSDVFSISNKRLGYDILDQLFNEAVNNDEQLQFLVDRIEKAREQKTNNWEDYATYSRNNQNYWEALAAYTNQLNDSSLRRNLQKHIEVLKENHIKKTASLTSMARQIETREKTLRDHEILMKIIITEPMMKNYQRNKFPDLKRLESTKLQYDSIIEQTKPYTKINN